MLILKRLAHSLPPNHITFAAKSLLKVWFKALLLHRVSDYGMNNGKPYKSSAHSGGFHSHGFGRAKGAYAGGKLGGKPAKSRDQEHRGRRHSSKSSSSSSSSTGRKQRKLERAQKYLLKHDRVYQDMVRQAEQQERSKALEGQGAILAKALQESLDKSVQLAVNVCTPSVDAATGSPSTSTSPSQGGQPFPPGPPGTTTREVDKIGNDKADEVAEEGVMLYGAAAVQTSNILTKRHISYAGLVTWLHDTFLEAVVVKKEKVEQKEKVMNPFKHITKCKESKKRSYIEANPPSYGNSDQYGIIKDRARLRRFVSKKAFGPMMHIQAFLGQHKGVGSSALGVQNFLRRLEFKPCHGEEQGTSWLELYILYKMAGGSCVVSNPASKAQARPSMRVQLKEFKRICRFIAKHTMAEEDAKLLKPNLSKKPRLWGLGIETHVAMVNFNVCIKSHAQRQISRHILKSGRHRTVKQVEEILHKQRHIPVSTLATVNRCGWSQAIQVHSGPIFASETEKSTIENVAPIPRDEVVPKLLEDVYKFKCDTCQCEVKSNRKAFRLDTLGAKTWCGNCKKSYEAKTWKCPCNLPWYECGVHRHVTSKGKEAQVQRAKRVAGGRSEGASKGDGGGKAECDTLSQNQLALLSSELQHKCTFANGSINAVTEAILAKPAGDRIFTGLLNTVITRYAGGDIPRNREARARAAFYAVQNM